MAGWSKDDQLAYHNRRKAEKAARSPKAKGNAFEKEVQAELQSTSIKPVRRNHQGKVGGGISNPDISFGSFDIEVKNEKTLSIPEWLRTKKAETPNNKKPGLVFHFEKDAWITIKLKDRMVFASDLIEAEGGEVSF